MVSQVSTTATIAALRDFVMVECSDVSENAATVKLEKLSLTWCIVDGCRGESVVALSGALYVVR